MIRKTWTWEHKPDFLTSMPTLSEAWHGRLVPVDHEWLRSAPTKAWLGMAPIVEAMQEPDWYDEDWSVRLQSLAQTHQEIRRRCKQIELVLSQELGCQTIYDSVNQCLLLQKPGLPRISLKQGWPKLLSKQTPESIGLLTRLQNWIQSETLAGLHVEPDNRMQYWPYFLYGVKFGSVQGTKTWGSMHFYARHRANCILQTVQTPDWSADVKDPLHGDQVSDFAAKLYGFQYDLTLL